VDTNTVVFIGGLVLGVLIFVGLPTLFVLGGIPVIMKWVRKKWGEADPKRDREAD